MAAELNMVDVAFVFGVFMTGGIAIGNRSVNRWGGLREWAKQADDTEVHWSKEGNAPTDIPLGSLLSDYRADIGRQQVQCGQVCVLRVRTLWLFKHVKQVFYMIYGLLLLCAFVTFVVQAPAAGAQSSVDAGLRLRLIAVYICVLADVLLIVFSGLIAEKHVNRELRGELLWY